MVIETREGLGRVQDLLALCKSLAPFKRAGEEVVEIDKV